MAVRKRLGEMLVEAGIIDTTQLHAALGHQRQWGGRLGQCLVEMKLASEEAIVEALAAKFGFEVAPLDRLEAYAFEQAKALIPHEYAARNSILPIAADTGVLVVAMSDPTNLALTDELAFRSGRRVKVTIAGERAIAAAIKAHYAAGADAPSREAIALDADDDGAVVPIYDPVGATSSEEMNRFYQAPSAPIPAAPHPPASARGPAPLAPAPARPAAPAAAPTRAANPALAAQKPAAAAAAAAPAPVAPSRPPPAAVPAAAAPPPAGRTRSPAELQLEDQPTGSMELDRLQTAPETLEEMSAEELQPIPLEPEPLEGEPLEQAQPEPTEQLELSRVHSVGTELPPAPPAAEPQAWAAEPAPQAAEPEPYVPTPETYVPSEEEWVEGQAPQHELTPEEITILQELAQLAAGDDAPTTLVRPAQLLAILARLLLAKGYVTERELFAEILKPQG
jgi:hypothetical protein